MIAPSATEVTTPVAWVCAVGQFAVEALPGAESVPVEFFLDFIESDPLTSDEDRAFFQALLTDEVPG